MNPQTHLAIERLELSTLALLARCSNRLSYTAFYLSKPFNIFHASLDSCLKLRILNGHVYWASRMNPQKHLAIERLELSTLALLARCSNRLSYMVFYLSKLFNIFHASLDSCLKLRILNRHVYWASRMNPQKHLAIERLELSTLALLARCSNRLSYTAFYLSKPFNIFHEGFDSCLKFGILNRYVYWASRMNPQNIWP